MTFLSSIIAWFNLQFRGLYRNRHGIPVHYIKQPMRGFFGRRYWRITRYGKKLGYMFSAKRPGVVVNPMKRLRKLVKRARVTHMRRAA